MELYEIESQAMFDEPVCYKGVMIYPITIQYYNLVKASSSVFSIDMASEKDIELFGLPYMEYLFKKAQKDENFLEEWNIFNSILQLSLKNQIFSFRYEGNFLKMIIAIPTEKYNEETMCVYREKLNKYRELSKDDFHAVINELQLKQIKEELDSIAEDIFSLVKFNDNDFEEIKKIICYLNDIDCTIINSRWEAELKKASEIMAKINKAQDPPQLEDLIDAVALSLNKFPVDIKDMTIRRFDRYLELQINRENYNLCKAAELNGTEFKKPIQNWLKAYKPKGRYASVQSNGGDLSNIFKE